MTPQQLEEKKKELEEIHDTAKTADECLDRSWAFVESLVKGVEKDIIDKVDSLGLTVKELQDLESDYLARRGANLNYLSHQTLGKLKQKILKALTNQEHKE